MKKIESDLQNEYCGHSKIKEAILAKTNDYLTFATWKHTRAVSTRKSFKG